LSDLSWIAQGARSTKDFPKFPHADVMATRPTTVLLQKRCALVRKMLSSAVLVDAVSGWQNKLQSAIANITPAEVLAEQHRRMAEPGPGPRTRTARRR
jgi:hypothetical protein